MLAVKLKYIIWKTYPVVPMGTDLVVLFGTGYGALDATGADDQELYGRVTVTMQASQGGLEDTTGG
jgi:hypothetical protein